MIGRKRPSADAAAVSGLPLHSNFVWILAGNIIYAACQWGLIVTLAKAGSSLMIGRFSLGLAIATPVLMFTNLNLRAVQATDAKRLYSFAEYLQLRSLMTLAALAVIAGLAWVERYDLQTKLVILAVAIMKATETLSDIHYGLFQLNDRLDQTGTSMMVRGALSIVGLSVGLYLTHDVFWGCIGVSLFWIATLLLFDFRRGRYLVARSQRAFSSLNTGVRWQPDNLRRLWNLVLLALPLGIVTTLASINLNMPRYFIEARRGEHELGIFSALAYATVAMTLVGDSMGHCTIPRMSRQYACGQFADFRAALIKLTAVGAALGLAGLLVAQVMGARLLLIFYSAEYAARSQVFVVLMIATAIHCVAGMLSSGITSARCFQVQAATWALVVASSALACHMLVPSAGLAGAAWAMVIGATVRLVLMAAAVAYLFWMNAKRPGRQAAQVAEWNPST